MKCRAPTISRLVTAKTELPKIPNRDGASERNLHLKSDYSRQSSGSCSLTTASNANRTCKPRCRKTQQNGAPKKARSASQNFDVPESASQLIRKPEFSGFLGYGTSSVAAGVAPPTRKTSHCYSPCEPPPLSGSFMVNNGLGLHQEIFNQSWKPLAAICAPRDPETGWDD